MGDLLLDPGQLRYPRSPQHPRASPNPQISSTQKSPHGKSLKIYLAPSSTEGQSCALLFLFSFLILCSEFLCFQRASFQTGFSFAFPLLLALPHPDHQECLYQKATCLPLYIDSNLHSNPFTFLLDHFLCFPLSFFPT